MAGEIEQGRDLDRVGAFSDGVFAIAITVLVLTISIPRVPVDELDDALRDLVPPVLAYFLSFYVVGVFWFSHHKMWHFIRRVDSRFLVLNMVLLAFVALLPFPTDLMGTYGETQEATIIYAVAVSLTGIASTALWWYVSENNRLLRDDTPRDYVRIARVRGASVPIVFLCSIPIALFDADLAKYSWLLLVPLHVWLARKHGSVYEM
ncbi:MAG: TMEM175 family protein [Acidimicrobiia bacterium]